MQRHQVITRSLLLVVALLTTLALADNEGTTCLNAQLNIVGQQDLICEIDSPFCVYIRVTAKQCEYCAVMQNRPTYGGSCNCDPTQYYCEQSNTLSGACYPYTMLDQQCTNDGQCQTSTDRVLADGSTTVTLLNEQLFCVNSLCKPCNPTEWAAQVGALGVAAITCAGYNAQISANIGRYATGSRLSGASYTCLANGDFQWINATVDYNYQYSCGDRTLWPNDCSGGTPSPSATPGGTSSVTPTVGTNNNASASLLTVVSRAFVAIVMLNAVMLLL